MRFDKFTLKAQETIQNSQQLAEKYSDHYDVNNNFWENGDEWQVEGGRSVDLMYRGSDFPEGNICHVLENHNAQVGYSTCILFNIANSEILYDTDDWFLGLKTKANSGYPDELVKAIIAKNHPILRRNSSSYMYQIRRAVERGDLVSVNHRVAALLDSYFDILFAVNEMPHPGEKRLIKIASEECERVPKGMRQGVNELVGALSRANREVIQKAEALVEGLDSLLIAEGLFPG